MEANEKQSIDSRMLKIVRDRTGLSQSAIGAALGCHQSDISRIERGLDTPDWLIKFVRLARLLEKTDLTWKDLALDSAPPTLRTAEKPGEYKT
jgi:transcriptional regulator with XRE-family HTH domain